MNTGTISKKIFQFLSFSLCALCFSTTWAKQKNPSIQSAELREEKTPEKLFIEGVEGFKAKNYDRAIQKLNRALSTDPLLDSYCRFFIAGAFIEKGTPQEALPFLQTTPLTQKEIDYDLFWIKIRALIDSKKWDEATQNLNFRQRSHLNSSTEQARVLFHLGLIAWHQNKKQEAKNIWRKLLVNNPISESEKMVLSFLETSSQNLEKILTTNEILDRAENMVQTGYAPMAIPIYEKRVPKSEFLAKTYFKARKYAQAALLYEELLKKNGTDKAKLTYQLASSLARSDQFEQALHYHQKIVTDFPQSSWANLSREKIPFIYFDSGKTEEAISQYEKMLPFYRGKALEKGKWTLLWSHYLLGHNQQALEMLAALEQAGKNQSQKMMYWKARILEKMKRNPEAKNIYKNLAQKKVSDYYAWLSSLRLEKNRIDHTSLSIHKRDTRIPSLNKNPFQKGERPSSNEDKLPLTLAQAGLDRYAYDESTQLQNNNYQEEGLAYYYHSHNFNRLIVLAQRAKGTLAGWAGLYPQAYGEIVNEHASKNKIDPKLVLSVMRQESHFKPFVSSEALALGLMQMIPQTATEVSQALGKTNFTYNDLKEPKVGIEFGTWYLAQLLRHFSGSLPYALSAYNAGPEAVTRWKKWGDKLEADEFIELIPYAETNNYVKKILVNYWIYKNLYP
ncbi:MAG: hypothetical protein A2048_08135 [Deltaproteobacteria bacterium GWA2_45_12]|nr:MAG: hypothetical protein A2048_08135 [Deltaproteobacteria bacterium GWA2_45_12]